MSTLNNPQIKPVSGGVHGAVDTILNEIQSKTPGGLNKDNLEKTRSQLYKHVSDLLERGVMPSADALRQRYNDTGDATQINRDQMEKSAGVASPTGKRVAPPADDFIRPGQEDSLGPKPQSGENEESQQAPGTGQSDQFQPWAAPSAKGPEYGTGKEGQPSTGSVQDSQGLQEASTQRQANNGNDFVTPESGAPSGKSESSGSGKSNKTGESQTNSKQSPAGHTNSAKDGLANEVNNIPQEGIPGAGATDHLSGLSAGEAKRLRDAFQHGGKIAGAKEGLRLAAKEGASKGFTALLEYAWADVGIITIGFCGTFLLVLGHMFNVQLQPWQKWLIILYDVVVGLLILILVSLIVAAYCETGGDTELCGSLDLQSILYAAKNML